MKITPIDIQEQKFKTSFRGYDREEVDAFLDVIAREMEELLRENSFLKEEIEKLNRENEYLKDMEESLKKTLVAAQKMAEDYKENAKKEAENIVIEARNRAEKIIDEAELRVSELNTELANTKIKIKEIKELVKGILSGFIQNLDKLDNNGR
ncbi:MAG: DivIVA domain-containing protein [Proteobacteria bacterium]|nr:DivIVA domain-containing protein [Pseudomonadota bacterium]